MTMPSIPSEARSFLAPTRYIDSDSAAVRSLVDRVLAGAGQGDTPAETAIRLFEAVRDGLRYDPYSFDPDPAAYRASAIAGLEAAFCVPKAILLTACLRAAGIPAAVGFADVKNHLNTPRLRAAMGTDLFIWHGYVKLWLGARSFKVTPAFNMALCERFGVKPLVFDATGDALFHEYDSKGRRHMQYVRDRGIFADPPIGEFLRAFRDTYPRIVTSNRERATSDPGFAPADDRRPDPTAREEE